MTAKNYVLVHGAFHGGWCWARVADRLRAAGHRVFSATMTGMGERQHLLSPALGMDTWVRDCAAIIESEELQDVILVGHSFGGFMISGVADLMPDRLCHLVYFDAAVPRSGVSYAAAMGPAQWNERLQSVVTVHGTRCVAPPEAQTYGVVDPADAAWVDRRMTPMPVSLFEDALDLRHPVTHGVPASYVRCSRPALPAVESSCRYAVKHGWNVVDLPAPHDAMVTHPDEVAAILSAIE